MVLVPNPSPLVAHDLSAHTDLYRPPLMRVRESSNFTTGTRLTLNGDHTAEKARTIRTTPRSPLALAARPRKGRTLGLSRAASIASQFAELNVGHPDCADDDDDDELDARSVESALAELSDLEDEPMSMPSDSLSTTTFACPSPVCGREFSFEVREGRVSLETLAEVQAHIGVHVQGGAMRDALACLPSPPPSSAGSDQSSDASSPSDPEWSVSANDAVDLNDWFDWLSTTASTTLASLSPSPSPSPSLPPIASCHNFTFGGYLCQLHRLFDPLNLEIHCIWLLWAELFRKGGADPGPYPFDESDAMRELSLHAETTLFFMEVEAVDCEAMAPMRVFGMAEVAVVDL